MIINARWEVRTMPWRNPRTGLTSDEEFTIVAIRRDRGWVQRIERQSAEQVASFDPESAWAWGLQLAGAR